MFASYFLVFGVVFLRMACRVMFLSAPKKKLVIVSGCLGLH